jgi:hypothetical protein
VALVVGLVALSLWAAYNYVANGIAYGAIFGLPGRAADLAAFKQRAQISLSVLVLLQILNIWVLASLFPFMSAVARYVCAAVTSPLVTAALFVLLVEALRLVRAGT